MDICCKCGKIELTYQKTDSGLMCLECSTDYSDEYIDNYHNYMLDYLIKNNLEIAINIYLEAEYADRATKA